MLDFEAHIIDGAWDLMPPSSRALLLHLCRGAAAAAAAGSAAGAAATGMGGAAAETAGRRCGAGLPTAALRDGAAAQQAAAGLLAAVEVQVLGQQLTVGGAPSSGAPAKGGDDLPARPGGAPMPANVRRLAARAALSARLALAVHDTVTGGARQSWHSPGAAPGGTALAPGRDSAPEVAAPLQAAAPDGSGHVALPAQELQAMAEAAGAAPASAELQSSGVARVARQLLRRRLGGRAGRPSAGGRQLQQAPAAGRADSRPSRLSAPQPRPAPPGPPPHQPPVSATSLTSRSRSGSGAAAAAAAAPPAPPPPPATPASGAAHTPAVDDEGWRTLPRHARLGYFLHTAIRMVWLAAMGDPSYWQDAMDLLGPPPSGPARPAQRGAAPACGWAGSAPLAAWAAYGARFAALHGLKLLAVLSRVGRAGRSAGMAKACSAACTHASPKQCCLR